MTDEIDDRDGAWGSAPSRRSRQNRVSKGARPLLQSPEAAPLAGFGAEPQVDRRSTVPSGALQGVNFKTVQWTVLKEVSPHGVGKCREATKGTARSALCKRECPLKFPVYFFRGGEIISVSKNGHIKKREISLFERGKFLSIFLYMDD